MPVCMSACSHADGGTGKRAAKCSIGRPPPTRSACSLTSRLWRSRRSIWCGAAALRVASTASFLTGPLGNIGCTYLPRSCRARTLSSRQLPTAARCGVNRVAECPNLDCRLTAVGFMLELQLQGKYSKVHLSGCLALWGCRLGPRQHGFVVDWTTWHPEHHIIGCTHPAAALQPASLDCRWLQSCSQGELMLDIRPNTVR
jgi:hypothetical protein